MTIRAAQNDRFCAMHCPGIGRGVAGYAARALGRSFFLGLCFGRWRRENCGIVALDRLFRIGRQGSHTKKQGKGKQPQSQEPEAQTRWWGDQAGHVSPAGACEN